MIPGNPCLKSRRLLYSIEVFCFVLNISVRFIVPWPRTHSAFTEVQTLGGIFTKVNTLIGLSGFCWVLQVSLMEINSNILQLHNSCSYIYQIKNYYWVLPEKKILPKFSNIILPLQSVFNNMVYTSKNLIFFHLYCYINLTLPNQGYRRQAPDSCPCLGGPVSLGYHPHTPRIHTPGLASGWRGPLVFCGILSYLSATIKNCTLKILMPKKTPTSYIYLYHCIFI